MADRPGGGDHRDDDQYSWLSDPSSNRPDPNSPSQDPDATQAMPRQDKPAEGAGTDAGATQAIPRQDPPAGGADSGGQAAETRG
ncbi:MAG: hypothetical protein M3353_05370, partial [Actinomycetota bacterium]|nr:hypothetical protein [Actinomycetota bacterium]